MHSGVGVETALSSNLSLIQLLFTELCTVPGRSQIRHGPCLRVVVKWALHNMKSEMCRSGVIKVLDGGGGWWGVGNGVGGD